MCQSREVKNKPLKDLSQLLRMFSGAKTCLLCVNRNGMVKDSFVPVWCSHHPPPLRTPVCHNQRPEYPSPTVTFWLAETLNFTSFHISATNWILIFFFCFVPIKVKLWRKAVHAFDFQMIAFEMRLWLESSWLWLNGHFNGWRMLSEKTTLVHLESFIWNLLFEAANLFSRPRVAVSRGGLMEFVCFLMVLVIAHCRGWPPIADHPLTGAALWSQVCHQWLSSSWWWLGTTALTLNQLIPEPKLQPGTPTTTHKNTWPDLVTGMIRSHNGGTRGLYAKST